MNKKKIISAIFIIIFLTITGAIMYDGCQRLYMYCKLMESPEKYSKDLKKYYEIPNELRVIDIVSENAILVKDDQELVLKVYDLENNEYKNETSVSNYDYAKTFDGGIVWVESINKIHYTQSKVFVKYFAEDSIIEIDNSNFHPIRNINVDSNYITYYIQDNTGVISVKLYDTKEKINKTIATYDINKEEDEVNLSEISTSCDYVVWSTTGRETSNIYRYDIKKGTTDVLSEKECISSPIVKGNRVFAIKGKMNINFSDNYNHDGDCLVEYNEQTKRWDKFTYSSDIKEESEKVRRVFYNEGFLYWESIIGDNKMLQRYVFDIENSKNMIPNPDDDIVFNVINIKDNIVHYQISNKSTEVLDVLYIYE